MNCRDHLKAMWRFYLSILILFVCIGVSLGGLYFAVKVTHCAGDAGRGGAIADMIALFVIFLDRSRASSLFSLASRFASDSLSTSTATTEKEVRKIVADEIKRFGRMLGRDSRRLAWQNFFLALATAIGTFFWGFGDMLVSSHVPKCP